MTTAPITIQPHTQRIFNFSAGPAVLPEEVLQQAQQDIWNIAGSGIGIMEHSHRGAVFDRVLEEAVADCRQLANISDNYDILFLQGGATTQFALVPMNFLQMEQVADYPDTGVWTSKAINEARRFGNVNIAFNGKAYHYDHTPSDDELKLSPDAVYLHYCSNNTIYGTRYHAPPTTSAPIVCDASSDIFSRPIDINKHALIYAGAQKNLGPAGVALVIIRKDMIERARPDVPTMFSYANHAKAGSRLNTPPTFGIYIMGQVFKWLLKQGGLSAMQQHNEDKAKLIYDVIDANDFYQGFARHDSRSAMNISFRTPSPELDQKFVVDAAEQGMDGLKGHRALGGLRASIYNAFPRQGCVALAQFMKDFAERHG